MKILVRLLISCFLLYPYSFGLFWLGTVNEAGSSEALQGASRFMFFYAGAVTLASLWLFTWLPNFRKKSCIGLFCALPGVLLFLYLGYPKSLGIFALSFPLLIISVIYLFQQRRTKGT